MGIGALQLVGKLLESKNVLEQAKGSMWQQSQTLKMTQLNEFSSKLSDSKTQIYCVRLLKMLEWELEL